MDPDRKRTIRLVVALSAAVLLATALVYTSFSASTEAKSTSELLAVEPTGTYEVYGRVVEGTVVRDDTSLAFEITDPEDTAATIPVEYEGQVPDPFREGRDVILRGEVVNGTIIAEKDSLITKCPSKFAEEAEEDPNIIIDENAP